ncbi:unnamed protein product, partial [Symbiodinium necroappetens]
PEITACVPSSLEANWAEAKAEPIEAEAVPSEPSIPTAEASPRLPLERSSEHADKASPVDRNSDYGVCGSEDLKQEPAEMHGSGSAAAVPGAVAKDATERPEMLSQSRQEGPEVTACAPSSMEAKAELKAQAVPSEPAEASPRLPLERSSEHADKASPVDRSSDCGGCGSQDFEQEPADKGSSGSAAAAPGAVVKDAIERPDKDNRWGGNLMSAYRRRALLAMEAREMGAEPPPPPMPEPVESVEEETVLPRRRGRPSIVESFKKRRRAAQEQWPINCQRG